MHKVMLLFCLLSGPLLAQAPKMVVIDQDGSGPGGSNQMAMLVLLRSPRVKVLGITMVAGDGREPEEVRHTLRMLELLGRTEIPVVPGAVAPLVRTERETIAGLKQFGAVSWLGGWAPGAGTRGALAEGEPRTKALDEDAAHFLVRQVRAHPHLVTIYAAGPLTNVALALSIDPEFAGLTQGIVIMGGSLNPVTDDAEFTTDPRHEFNFWFDPEAAHIVLRAGWPRIDLTTVDVSLKAPFTPAMLEAIGTSASPVARYVKQWSKAQSYLWDELAAAAWLDPAIITKERKLYVDVELARGASYGETLTWNDSNKPDAPMPLVHVQTDLDLGRFTREFVELMRSAPIHP